MTAPPPTRRGASADPIPIPPPHTPCPALQVTKEEDLPRIMREFLFSDPHTPVVLNAVCEADEHVYPMVAAGQALDQCIVSRPARPERV